MAKKKPSPNATNLTLAFVWEGMNGNCWDPVKTWMHVCERYFPEFLPDHYGSPKKPITPEAKAELLTGSNRAITFSLWHNPLFGEICFSLPLIMDWENSQVLPDPGGLYTIYAWVWLDAALVKSSLARLEEFFVAISQHLHAELALAEALAGWRSWGSKARFQAGAENRNLEHKHRGNIFGLPTRPVWAMWMGQRYADLTAPWLHTSLPTTWDVTTYPATPAIPTPDSGHAIKGPDPSPYTAPGLLIKTAPFPIRSQDLPPAWFPRDYLPGKTFFGKLKPAKLLPHGPRAYGPDPKRA
ncbi:hypothetical protein ABYF32_01710 [Buchananella felis]|uniref:hypothetical protein n=1 Tax=Buchananella felis TaxID=3231492 RepID=UPI0035281C83